jgi:YbbR domain-containing protein
MKKKIPIIIIALLFSIVLWVSISLSKDYYATFDIPLKIVDYPNGYTTGSAIPHKISVKLKGKGWKLASVNFGTESDYIISAGSDSGRKFINISNYLSENQWLSSEMEVIDLYPDTLSFVVEKISEKKVMIIPDYDITFKNGYGLASKTKLIPDSVTIYGPESLLRNIVYAETEKIQLKNLDKRYNEQKKLKEIFGIEYRINRTLVRLDVQKIIDNNYDDISVDVTDVPRDRDVVLLPNRITVGVRGGIEMVGKLSRNDISAKVMYRDIVADTTGSVIPSIELPENLSLYYKRPERLRYIIKKFN